MLLSITGQCGRRRYIITNGKNTCAEKLGLRVGGFGFLAGKELAAEHSTNLGLRDQRLGLKWVQVRETFTKYDSIEFSILFG